VREEGDERERERERRERRALSLARRWPAKKAKGAPNDNDEVLFFQVAAAMTGPPMAACVCPLAVTCVGFAALLETGA